MKHILLIEDEAVIRGAVAQLLRRQGYRVSAAGSLEEAEAATGFRDCDLIIADLRLPGLPGTEAIARAPGVPVLIITSYASVRSAVEAMKLGAVDYIAKPFDHDQLLRQVGRILKRGADAAAPTTAAQPEAELKMEIAEPVAGMVGNCPAMQEIRRRIAKIAPTASTVLILGESGTGKELVARALHQQSPRRDAPFVTVNCAAIPENRVESEIFGNQPAAAGEPRPGLVESADGGTLFLDEIGDLPQPSQARLLRLLQDGEVQSLGSDRVRHLDLRLIASSNHDLKQLVQDGRFRSDLYFRLRVMEFQLPPLRERGDDLPELARYLLAKACSAVGRPELALSAKALEAVRRHPWPGNVRELENSMQRAAILAEDQGPVTPELLAIEPHTAREPAADTDKLSLEEYFRRFLLQHQEQMTETELARHLGISRKTLWERRQRFGIPRSKGSA
jgi:DNA-binding NtrC family response regulator